MEGTDSTNTISHSVWRFFSGTMVSRVTGLGRDVVMAASFGSHPSVAAFMVAFRFSHLLRRLLGEGAMQAAFVPHFEEARQRDQVAGNRFFLGLLVWLSIGLIALVGIGELALWWASGALKLSAGNREIIDLTRVMLPSLLFICLFGLNAGYLQCEKRFFLPAVSPALFNVVWILFAWSCRAEPVADAMPWLSGGIVLACFFQWALTVPPVWTAVRDHIGQLRTALMAPELRGLVRALGLGVLGVGASQINSAMDAVFARAADPSGPAYLWYAIRVQQLPIGLFGVALAGALLPPLSRAAKQGDLEKFQHFLSFSVTRASAFIIPFACAYGVGGAASLNLLYGRGDFGVASLSQTTLCLWGYTVGMFPMLVVMVIAPSFYARSQYRVPTIGALVAVLVNLGCNSLFVFGFGWGSVSVALATSLSSAVNCVYLLWQLNRQMPGLAWKPVQSSLLKITGVSVAAMVGAGLVGCWIADPTLALLSGDSPIFVTSTIDQFVHYGVLAGVFAGLLAVTAWITETRELTSLIKR